MHYHWKMYYLIVLYLNLFLMPHQIVFDFNSTTDISQWQITNDAVMGGRSQGSFHLNEEGNGVFTGTVSLKNNGGFSLVRHQMERFNCSTQKKFVLRIKGDGKRYQFRVRAEANSAHAYACYFNTTGDWQTIDILFNEMYPVFRGRKLSQPNFEGSYLEEIGFLIGNKKEENFLLEIDKIEMR